MPRFYPPSPGEAHAEIEYLTELFINETDRNKMSKILEEIEDLESYEYECYEDSVLSQQEQFTY